MAANQRSGVQHAEAGEESVKPIDFARSKKSLSAVSAGSEDRERPSKRVETKE